MQPPRADAEVLRIGARCTLEEVKMFVVSLLYWVRFGGPALRPALLLLPMLLAMLLPIESDQAGDSFQLTDRSSAAILVHSSLTKASSAS